MIFKVRMLSDEVEDFARVYEVMYDMSLLDFHDFICDDLEYDSGNFSSFFMSNENWEKLQEYTLVDMQDDDSGVVALPMKDTLLGQIIKEKHDRLMFMFDIFAARSFFLELQEAGEVEGGVKYPRIAYSEGDPPQQLEADSLMSEDSPFNDIMEEFNDFDGSDDAYDEF